MNNLKIHKLSNFPIFPPYRICFCLPASAESSRALRQMLDLSLLRNAIFIMFAASNFLTSIGFNVPYVYTVVSKKRSYTQYSRARLSGNRIGEIQFKWNNF